MGSFGTQNPSLTGTNDFIMVFSKDLAMQILRLFYSFSSGPLSI